ncbi:polysaccharide biosynthesis protein [Gordonibacter urolithinfaciens]|uniref:lipopolysaccharide biosynthesis protein n=1 Tax=Gordonibacter urolithinfaciens TaxID=1335613 RepID=UPI000B3A344D|nr:polysaccharide biosynthesis protein [Gordonibacter urolithinfaciens]OUO87452.1 polysaccharide biosynthesis protein [Gordonibacter urolithinfaciens]
MKDQHQKSEPEGLSMGKNMAWNSFGSITYLACQWLITILVVRLSSGYEAAGTLSLAMSVYNIFAPLALYRMYTYQVSDVNHENTAGEYFTLRLITSVFALVCCMLYAVATCTPSSLAAILLYALFKIAALLIDVLHGVDQINKRMDYIGKSLILQGVLSLVAFCVTFATTSSLESSLGAMIATTVLVGIFYDVPHSVRFERVKLGISRKKALHLLVYCFPIVIAAVACGAAPSIPRQVLAFMDGESMLGIYASVAAPVAIIQMGASYLYNPLLSVIAEYFAKGEKKKLLSLIGKVALGIAAIGVVCALGFELFGAWVLGLIFGPSIVPYTYLLLPIIASTIISAFVWFLNDLLVALRCFKGSFVGNMVAAAIAIPASYFFVAQWDMNGVSCTSIVAYAAGALIMVAFVASLFRKKAS